MKVKHWMLWYVRTYIYPFALITGAVGGSNRSAVNLKQCSRRGLNDERENGLVYVSTFVYWNNNSSNVGATHVLSAFVEYSIHCI